MQKRDAQGRFLKQPKNGGLRPGAGRPSLDGYRRVVGIKLPEEQWRHIDYLVASRKVDSVAEYFRIIADGDDDRRRELLIF